MSEPKFTPGPWAQFLHSKDVEMIILPAMRPGELARVHLDHAEGDANAHLIAAAPDLYRAVKLLLSAVDHLAGSVGQGWQSQDASAEGRDACDFAEQSLAKARGEP